MASYQQQIQEERLNHMEQLQKERLQYHSQLYQLQHEWGTAEKDTNLQQLNLLQDIANKVELQVFLIGNFNFL